MLETPIRELTRLGMTEYEARTYAGLVGLGEGTARQVHEASDVPRPRVYDVLDSLEAKGFVEVWQGKPKYYRAVPLDRLMRILREDMEESMGVVSTELSELSLQAKQRSFPVWHIKGELSIQDQVRALIQSTKDELFVVCTRTSSLRPLVKDLKKIGEKADVLCMVPEGASTFREVLSGIRVVEPSLGSDPLTETYVKIFTGKFQASDERYRVEMLIIVDGLRSLLIYEVNAERTAIVFELPLITALQRSAIAKMVEEADG